MNDANKDKSPCDYCINGAHTTGITCQIKMCYEYSRWKSDGTAPKDIISTVEDFHESLGIHF